MRSKYDGLREGLSRNRRPLRARHDPPSAGINVFGINSIVKGMRIVTIYGGMLPFILTDIIRLACT
ncbi:MAG TPA: hypothetical protein VFZ16_01200 [Hyphomicrobiaceae bacterium]|nr:hypothetical protein [Hyphomicrobiaceae bacterium]